MNQLSAGLMNMGERTLDREHGIAVAPFCLLRTAALPYGMLEAMRLERTNELVLRLLAAESEMAASKALLEPAFHDVVGGLDAEDVSLRRLALNLKRDIYNARPTLVADADIPTITARLSPEAKATFARWHCAQHTVTQVTAALEGVFQDEMQQRLRPALRAPLKVDSFRNALAFASVGVAKSVAREKSLPTAAKPDNLERSLLGYLIRASAKTSPFSSFMGLSLVEADPTAVVPYPFIRNASYASRTRLNRGILSRIYRASVVETVRSGGLELAVNSTLCDVGAQRVQALCDRDVVIGGRPWCEQRWTQFRLDDRIIKALLIPPLDRTWSGWCQHLVETGLKAADAQAILEKLIERSLLQALPLADAFDENPERTLARIWGACSSTKIRAADAAVTSMAGLAASISEAPSDARAAAVDEIRRSETLALSAFGKIPVESFQNMVLEDFWVGGVEGKLGANLLEPLADLERFLATQVVLSPYYRRLRDRFVAEFGEGGVCRDLVGFLLRVGDKLIDIPEFGAKPLEDPLQPAEAGAALVVTAQLQVAAGPTLKHPLAVVNQVFEGVGWLAARFTAGARPEQAMLRDSLAAWLRKVTFPCEPVDLVLSGQCNDLQAHARLTDRVLKWPGEPLFANADEVIPAETLRLAHNPETGLLDLFDQAGTQIRLVYLGSTFPTPTWGVRYALSILSQPFLLGRPSISPPLEQGTGEMIFEPRRYYGKIVLTRARCWVKTAYLKRVWFQKTGAARLVQVRRDCMRNAIPEVFFAQRNVAADLGAFVSADALSADRKPIWVDIGNPFCLGLLERLAEDSDWICLAEQLPGPDALWLNIDGGRHVSELQIEMMVRAQPGFATDSYTARRSDTAQAA